MTSTNY